MIAARVWGSQMLLSYLFIDGGFLQRLIAQAADSYGIELNPLELNYSNIGARFARTFYYDAWPARKNEKEEEYEAIISLKQKLFDRINRTPNMHVRPGLTRNRSPKKTLEQKGVDILLAIDVLKHASLRNIAQAHIMTTDLDFFPLFEALLDTPVSVNLHCFPSKTSNELMSLADNVMPITPYTVLTWFAYGDRDKFVQAMPAGELAKATPIKKGTCAGLPYFIYYERSLGTEMPYFGRSMAIDNLTVRRAAKLEHILWEFEARYGHPVELERSPPEGQG
jgi:uncharacterized LabA/DUF88 family protein